MAVRVEELGVGVGWGSHVVTAWSSSRVNSKCSHGPWLIDHSMWRLSPPLFAVVATLGKATQEKYSHIPTAFRTIWREEGIRGFYRGYSTSAIIMPTFWALYFPVPFLCLVVAEWLNRGIIYVFVGSLVAGGAGAAWR